MFVNQLDFYDMPYESKWKSKTYVLWIGPGREAAT